MSVQMLREAQEKMHFFPQLQAPTAHETALGFAGKDFQLEKEIVKFNTQQQQAPKSEPQTVKEILRKMGLVD